MTDEELFAKARRILESWRSSLNEGDKREAWSYLTNRLDSGNLSRQVAALIVLLGVEGG